MIIHVVAKALNNVIGKENKLIWKQKTDLQVFKKITLGKMILMGRNTFDSIGGPLPNRLNIVATRSEKFYGENDKLKYVKSKEMLELLKNSKEDIYVIGGSQVYKETLQFTNMILMTEIKSKLNGDVFYPELNEEEWIEFNRQSFKADKDNQYDYDFVTLIRKA